MSIFQMPHPGECKTWDALTPEQKTQAIAIRMKQPSSDEQVDHLLEEDAVKVMKGNKDGR